MRPLRSARQNSSSEGSLESDEDALLSIWRSHSAASYLLEAVPTTMSQHKQSIFKQDKEMAGNLYTATSYGSCHE